METVAGDGEMDSLEVKGGDNCWKSVCRVRLLLEDNSMLSLSNISPPFDQNGVFDEIRASRKQLPRSVKTLLLGPTTSIYEKNHRQSGAVDVNQLLKHKRKRSYLFRHAPAQQPNTNLMILMHGAGDTHIPFDQLGRNMALPQTATLAISAQGPFGELLPLQLGYTWFKEIDYETGDQLTDCQVQQNMNASASQFCQLLFQLIVREQWIIPERVFLFGYGAGAALAMQVCVLWNDGFPQMEIQSTSPLGGAICVAGGVCCIPNSITDKISTTPILLVVGENDESFHPSKAKKIQQQYDRNNGMELHIEPKKGQGMIQSENEMHTVMRFLSERLVRISAMPTA